MQNQDHYRRKTRSQLVDQEKQASRPQIPSQTNLDPIPHNSDIDSSKIKQQKHQPTRKSNWNRKQRIKYYVFLNYYSDLPHWGSDLKSIPTYKALSQFIKSRSPEQCKSFHLSTRRSFRSIEEELKVIQEELQSEEGYQRMLDRYEIEIIGFEEEHNLLKSHEMEEKKYFQNKFVQNCKQNELSNNNKEVNASDSPPNVQNTYNPKFNIKELINKEGEQKRKDEKSQVINTYQPLINMHYDQANSSQGQKIPSTILNNPQRSGMNYYRQEGPTRPSQGSRNYQKSQMERRQLQEINQQIYGARNASNHQNQRLIQENINRMMQANKNMFPQYSNYTPYNSSPFSSINQMHMSQFRNQLPYSMPPPGGIPYMMQGYHEPYNLNNISSSYDDPNIKAKPNKPQPQNHSSQKIRSNKKITDPNEQQFYSERRKELLINCHQHWLNWLRAVTELNRRKLMGINVAMNSNSQ